MASRVTALVNPTLVSNGPGVAVLVMQGDSILLSEGYGFADVDSRAEISSSSVFDLASVSKQLTGLAIQILAERGDIDVDQNVVTYLTDFTDHYPSRKVKVSDLLYHVSGLIDYSSEWDGTDLAFQQLTLEGHLSWLNTKNATAVPGTTYEYNNSGYALLALIVQRVSGKDFATFMQDEIFSPLGMSATLVMDDYREAVPNAVTGYIVEDEEVSEEVNRVSLAGDGNIFSSLEDMAKLDRAWRNHTLISAQSTTEAFTAGRFDNGTLIEDAGLGYGFGWEIGNELVSHSGSWDGTSTYYLHRTGDNITVIVLSNDSEYDGETLTHSVADLVAD